MILEQFLTVEEMAPAMCVVLLLCIFSGYPVAFSLGGVALFFGAVGTSMADPPFTWAFLNGVFERLMGVVENQVLLAVPYFILMGTILEKSKLAEDLLHTIGQLFGAARGGLAHAVVFVGALLAAATGVIGASVVAMGMISLPVMLRYRYSPSLACGVIAASGTLGQIIPPSVVLVVLADQIADPRCSVGDLFTAALTPGLMLAGLYAAYVVAVSVLRPDDAPALPPEERDLDAGQLARRVAVVLVPPLALIAIVLGSIFAGVATPTEAGALGAMGAMGLAWFGGRFTREMLTKSLQATTLLTTMVMFLLIGSTAFTHVFRGFYGDEWIVELLTGMPGGFLGALIITNIAIFLLGFFIDFFEIAFIVVPLLAPVFIVEFGVHPAHFGVMLAMNLQTSFLTPPFGFALFYLKGAAPPEVTTGQIYRGVIPFIIIQLLALIAVIAYPQIVTWPLETM